MKQHPRNSRARGGRRKAAPRRDPLIGFETTATIREIGARGDGIASVTVPNGANIIAYVDCVLPGDEVRVALRQKRGDGYGAELIELITRSAPASEPRCSHFQSCGGCALQHLDDAAYRDWKRQKAVIALQRAGIEPDDAENLVGAVEISPPATRRRAGFAVHVSGSGVHVGFHGRFSHTVIDITDCAVLHPELMAFRDAFATFLRACDLTAAKVVNELFVTLVDNGLDVVIHASAEPGLDMRQDLAELAQDQDLARLSWKVGDAIDEPVAARRTPTVTFEGVVVPVPPGGFLQATHTGEVTLANAIKTALQQIPARHVADLFCGIGSFTFALALGGDRRNVLAVESDPRAVRSLQYAVGQSASPIKVVDRDLFRRPLDRSELSGLDLVLFDPPRAGALAQCENLAVDGPEWVLAVSCNPATFARDIRMLRNGGYEVQEVMPVDQFLWSTHLEMFAVLRRRSPAV
tara:strand:- start:25683 stop:27077 length:1395 start_codon:yes stop_codon:yes gene_type:complete